MANKMEPCLACGGEMKIDYENDQDYERGYYAVCDTCGIYFGLDSEAVDKGYFWGRYGNEGDVVKAWNKIAKNKAKKKKLDFANKVITALENCYLQDTSYTAIQFNLGVGAAISEVRHLIEEREG